MKTLYVSDLDGTLLDRDDKVPAKSIEILNRLITNNINFTYATARSLCSATVVTKGLNVKLPVIVYNGAFIMSPDDGKIISGVKFTSENIFKVSEVLKQNNVSPLVYSFINNVESVSYVVDNENDGLQRYLSLRKNDKRFRALYDENNLYEGDVFYFTCIGDKSKLMPVYEAFKESKDYRCTIQQELYRPEFWCEIMPSEATKSNAIIKLKQLYGYDKIISFGDAINDIPMFEISDECYAVENAVDELKEKATGIIKSNLHNGVAEWIMQNCK